jgi:hypothetical protein
MKKILLLMIVLFSVQAVKAQNQENPAPLKQKKFHIGAFYSYYNTWYELKSLSMSSVWEGVDLGTLTLDDKELDTLNDLRTDKNDLHMVAIEPGMVFLNNSRWYFDGGVFFGISRIKYETNIDLPGENHKEVSSEFNNLVGGLSVNLRFNISKRWGITMMPHFIYSWGNAYHVVDSIRPNVSFFINDLEEEYSMGYFRSNLMASYSVAGFTISLGPGFYYSFMNRTYFIDRTNPENMDKYHDQIESSFHSVAFIDACLRADWTLIDPITLSFEAAAGKDLFIKTGIRFNF